MLAPYVAAACSIGFVSAVLPALAQPSPDGIMKNMDANRDGRISRQEWRGPPKGFDILDKNRDGQVTAAELQAGVPKSRVAAPRLPVIDVHVHVHGHPSSTVQQRMKVDYAAAAAVAIAQMDKNNVRKSVIMVPPSIHAGRFDDKNILEQARRHPDRLAVLGGGGTLNPMIHAIKPGAVTAEVRREFEEAAEETLRAGAIGFGEMSALHFSFFGQHPFEETSPDHPLFLALADVAARNDVPIDLHTEIVPLDMPTPPKLLALSKNNPPRIKSNLAAFERLLAHNPKARIILDHSADATGGRKAKVVRELLERHANLYMSLNVLPGYPLLENLPLKGSGGIDADWLQLVKDFPDRFMVGSDQFYSPPCANCKTFNSVTPTMRWIELLPDDVAGKVAYENPRRIFKLD
jgi:predicted TIM-barrel fold metal-dependent hydrolase